jgi:hypothetical protein
LTLRRLEDELKKKRIDPEMLKKLGMTEDQFRERAQRALERAKAPEKVAGPLVGKEREGFGNRTDLSKRSDRKGGTLSKDDMQGLSDDIRANVPEAYRARFEAYQKSLAAPLKQDAKSGER